MTPHRVMFWQIENVWIFYVLAGLATGLFLAGVVAYVTVWKKSSGSLEIPFSKEALKRMTLDVFLGRRVLQGDIAAGLMHLLIFWGFLSLFIGTSLLAIHHYIFTFLEGTAHLIFSFGLEVGGLMLLIGIIWALIRRYLQRVPRLERRLEDAVVPLWLLLAAFSGFILEGLRLTVEQPPWGVWSFVGWRLSGLFSPAGAECLYPYLWWGHTVLCLGFIAVIPYTKLFHIMGAPAGIYLQGASKPTVPAMEEDAGEFDLGDAIFFDGCMRCGRCVEACPSTGAGEPFAPRDFVQAMRQALWQEHFPLGDIRFMGRKEENKMDENLWYCTTCRACLEVCPVYGAAFEVVSKKRVLAVEEGTQIPKLMNQTLEKLFKYNNPWESSKRKRGAWADGLELIDLTKRGAEADLCYFAGCTTSFDDSAQVIARSFSKVLQIAGVNFGILGKKEPCCGDIARRVGELGLFEEQREGSEELFDKYGITEVATSSPHCFHTFKNEYPETSFRARHYTQILRALMADGKLRFKKGMEATVTYHDPCYLGRHNRIFDEPREIIRAIPGISLTEMNHYRADSLCCGGGGGRMWQDLQGEVKMSEVRIREAEATGAEILITACPLCLIMLEDARKAVGLKEPFRVMDLNELVLQALIKLKIEY
ncbi:MAG: 4Fe-4S dicluster domain-containing protein [Deltaproteobacteria bacterium]|uniref:4Fe-4S dicluster domain-containing protein n=1 Tax=Candidatus Desulfacyla euxinica TaxID=2841693 RepID=A0A8J6T2X6_9DELT|nr:4Fe-4S dicluster domain-containing protein [Candidatus Desulfacyla euxinica]